MKLKQDCQHALVIPTSMGTRLTPLNGQPFHCSTHFQMQVTSAESNVGSILSYLGLPVQVLTAFVKDSPISRLIKDNLASRHMSYQGPEFDQGGPWGYRHQINFADSGAGSRRPRVANDRAGEVGRMLRAEDFDLERIFSREGAQFVHLSGLIAALSTATSQFCLEVARVAKANGTRISFDLNHRATLWQGREEELREVFVEIASLTDVLVGHESHFQLCLGIESPPRDETPVGDRIDRFQQVIGQAKEKFPDTSLFATTLREVLNANLHQWGAIVTSGDRCHVMEPRAITVLDPIGGGDGFMGGLLYGIIRGWELEKAAQFGWASGALATTLLTDYAQPADEQQVWDIWEGKAWVQR